MDPNTILALIADLYGTVQQQAQKIRELEEQLSRRRKG